MTTTTVPKRQSSEVKTAVNARVTLIEGLLAQGAVPFVPEGRIGPAPQPIPVRGEPVSETIVAERR